MPNQDEKQELATSRTTETVTENARQTTTQTTVRQTAYTRADTPYSGAPRYNYSQGQYRQGDKPFQFPWWAILVAFMVWWPLSLVFIGINAAIKNGKLGVAQKKMRTYMQDYDPANVRGASTYAAPYSAPAYADNAAQSRKSAPAQSAGKVGSKLVLALTIFGMILLACGALALPEGLYWLPHALVEGDYYWTWFLEDTMGPLLTMLSGFGCLFGAHKIRTTRRMRKKIDNIVGDAKYMYIKDIAAAVPCSYEKCCKHLENCIDAGVFGPDAYLDMRHKCLVVEGRPPEPEEKKPRKKAESTPEKDRYQEILDELRRVNDDIPGEEMTAKISRLEKVSAKIFEQVKADPEKLPRMRKFMDYYLPTSLKLLHTYAELEAQGVEGENITESKKRIEQTMDTLVHAFETQLDQMFESDALDVSADIDVMQNMLRADGLTDEKPFKL